MWGIRTARNGGYRVWHDRGVGTVGNEVPVSQEGAGSVPLREQRGLTIASLARQVGISAAAISQIESGAVQPSVMTLRKLAAALGVPVFRFFLPADTAAASVIRRGERKTLGVARTGARYELLTLSLQGQLEVMEVSLDPGQASAPEPVSHPGEECLVIISGRGALELGDDVNIAQLQAQLGRAMQAPTYRGPQRIQIGAEEFQQQVGDGRAVDA
jgi:transcriptional regulator with XRE-family HTH domain